MKRTARKYPATPPGWPERLALIATAAFGAAVLLGLTRIVMTLLAGEPIIVWTF
jgi:hypothetical protein